MPKPTATKIDTAIKKLVSADEALNEMVHIIIAIPQQMSLVKKLKKSKTIQGIKIHGESWNHHTNKLFILTEAMHVEYTQYEN